MEGRNAAVRAQPGRALVLWRCLACFTASRGKQTTLQDRFDRWRQNLLDGCHRSPGTIECHLGGDTGQPGHHSAAPVVRRKSTTQKAFPQLMAGAFSSSGKLLPRRGQRAKSTNASSTRQQMPPGSCQQVFYLPPYFREGHSLKSPTVALTFSSGRVGPSSTSRLASCHESSAGRCEIAGDSLAAGTPVLSFRAFDSL